MKIFHICSMFVEACMDIKIFSLLCDIAKTKNLTSSAANMGYTQSAISHAIRKLEDESGVVFLKRTRHGVEFTNEGKQLMPYVNMIVKYYNVFNETIDSINGLYCGSISIGTYPSIASQWLPIIIKEFKKKYPDITISVREGRMFEVEKWIMDGTIDFGFLSWRKNQSFKFITLARDPVYVITSKHFIPPESIRGAFPVKMLENYPFIASESGMDRDDISNFLKTQEVKIKRSFSCRDDYTIIKMVENDLGIAFLPELILHSHDSNIHKFPVLPAAVRTLGIGMLSEKSLSISSKELIKISKKVIANLTADSPVGPVR